MTNLTVLPANPASTDGRGLRYPADRTAVLAALNARDVVLDQEHSVLLRAPLGKSSPALGWLSAFRFDNHGALVADVRYTERGLATRPTHPYVDAAVRLSDDVIEGIHSVALLREPSPSVSANTSEIACCAATSAPAPLQSSWRGWRETARNLESANLPDIAAALPAMMLDPDQRRMCDLLGVSYEAFLATAGDNVSPNAASDAGHTLILDAGEFLPIAQPYAARLRLLWPAYQRMAKQLGITWDEQTRWQHFQTTAAPLLQAQANAAQAELERQLSEALSATVAANAATTAAVAQLDKDQLRMCELLGVSPAAFARTRGELP
jgi:phage I-like protein